LVSLLTAREATVGDNLIGDLLAMHIGAKGFPVHHFYAKGSKLTIFGGGGLIWEHTYPPLLEQARKAVNDGSTVIGIGLGVQGFFSPEKFSFVRNFKHITVRNKESKHFIEDLLGVHSEVTADLVWLVNPPIHEREKNVLGVVVPNISKYPLIMDALSQIKDYAIRYIPLSLPAVTHYVEAQKRTGGAICSNVSCSNPLNALREISKCTFVLAGHYHTVIACFLTGTPCIVLPLRDKVRWLAERLEHTHFMALTDDEIIIKLKLLERHSDLIRHRMRINVDREKNLSRRNLEVIDNYLQ